MNISEMKKEIDSAAINRNKTAMLHYLTLKYAAELQDCDLAELTKQLGLTKSMSKEISKMRSLYLLMQSKNLQL